MEKENIENARKIQELMSDKKNAEAYMELTKLFNQLQQIKERAKTNKIDLELVKTVLAKYSIIVNYDIEIKED